MSSVALDSYFHIVAVDVIWTHNIGITVLQDDPGVIDLWEEKSGKKFIEKQWES